MSKLAEAFWLLTVLYAVAIGISLGSWATLNGFWREQRPHLEDAAFNAILLLLFAAMFYRAIE